MITVGIDDSASKKDQHKAHMMLRDDRAMPHIEARLLRGERIAGLCLLREGYPVEPDELSDSGPRQGQHSTDEMCGHA